MSEVAIREAINSGWFVISISLVWLFAHYLSYTIFERDWFARMSNRAALALLTFFAGEAAWRVWTMAVLLNPSYRGSSLETEGPYWLALTGAALALVGGLCTFRIFSPISWGHWGWIVVGVITIAYASVVLFLP